MGKQSFSIAEAKAALKGKILHVFSGWSGSHEEYVVKNIRHDKIFKGKYQILGKVFWNTVTEAQLLDLIKTSRHEHRETCDGCTYTVSLTLK